MFHPWLIEYFGFDSKPGYISTWRGFLSLHDPVGSAHAAGPPEVFPAYPQLTDALANAAVLEFRFPPFSGRSTIGASAGPEAKRFTLLERVVVVHDRRPDSSRTGGTSGFDSRRGQRSSLPRTSNPPPRPENAIRTQNVPQPRRRPARAQAFQSRRLRRNPCLTCETVIVVILAPRDEV